MLTIPNESASFLVFYSFERLHNVVTICLVGKYTSLEDAYTSVTKALRHAALACNHKLNLEVSTTPLNS